MRIWAPSRLVEDLGELENTIVIFMSDNGGTPRAANTALAVISNSSSMVCACRQIGNSDVARDIDLIGALERWCTTAGWACVKHAVSPLQGFTHPWGARSLSLQLAQGIDEQSRGQVRREYQYVTDLLRRCSNSPASSGRSSFARRGRGARCASFAASLNDSDYLMLTAAVFGVHG